MSQLNQQKTYTANLQGKEIKLITTLLSEEKHFDIKNADGTINKHTSKATGKYELYTDLYEGFFPTDFGTFIISGINELEFTSNLNNTGSYPSRIWADGKNYYYHCISNTKMSKNPTEYFEANKNTFNWITPGELKSDSAFISISVKSNYDVPISFYQSTNFGIDTSRKSFCGEPNFIIKETFILSDVIKANTTKNFKIDCRKFNTENSIINPKINNLRLAQPDYISCQIGNPGSYTITTYIIKEKNTVLSGRVNIENNQIKSNSVKWMTKNNIVFTKNEK